MSIEKIWVKGKKDNKEFYPETYPIDIILKLNACAEKKDHAAHTIEAFNILSPGTAYYDEFIQKKYTYVKGPFDVQGMFKALGKERERENKPDANDQATLWLKLNTNKTITIYFWNDYDDIYQNVDLDTNLTADEAKKVRELIINNNNNKNDKNAELIKILQKAIQKNLDVQKINDNKRLFPESANSKGPNDEFKLDDTAQKIYYDIYIQNNDYKKLSASITYLVNNILKLSDPKHDPRTLIFRIGGMNSHAATYAIRIDRRAGKHNEILVTDSLRNNNDDEKTTWHKTVVSAFNKALKQNKLPKVEQSIYITPIIFGAPQSFHTCAGISSMILLAISGDPDLTFTDQRQALIDYMKFLCTKEQCLRQFHQALIDLGLLETNSGEKKISQKLYELKSQILEVIEKPEFRELNEAIKTYRTALETVKKQKKEYQSDDIKKIITAHRIAKDEAIEAINHIYYMSNDVITIAKSNAPVLYTILDAGDQTDSSSRNKFQTAIQKATAECLKNHTDNGRKPNPQNFVFCAHIGGGHWATYVCNTDSEIMVINSAAGYDTWDQAAIEGFNEAFKNKIEPKKAIIIRPPDGEEKHKFRQRNTYICGHITAAMCCAISPGFLRDQQKSLETKMESVSQGTSDPNTDACYKPLREEQKKLSNIVVNNFTSLEEKKPAINQALRVGLYHKITPALENQAPIIPAGCTANLYQFGNIKDGNKKFILQVKNNEGQDIEQYEITNYTYEDSDHNSHFEYKLLTGNNIKNSSKLHRLPCEVTNPTDKYKFDDDTYAYHLDIAKHFDKGKYHRVKKYNIKIFYDPQLDEIIAQAINENKKDRKDKIQIILSEPKQILKNNFKNIDNFHFLEFFVDGLTAKDTILLEDLDESFKLEEKIKALRQKVAKTHLFNLIIEIQKNIIAPLKKCLASYNENNLLRETLPTIEQINRNLIAYFNENYAQKIDGDLDQYIFPNNSELSDEESLSFDDPALLNLIILDKLKTFEQSLENLFQEEFLEQDKNEIALTINQSIESLDTISKPVWIKNPNHSINCSFSHASYAEKIIRKVEFGVTGSLEAGMFRYPKHKEYTAEYNQNTIRRGLFPNASDKNNRFSFTFDNSVKKLYYYIEGGAQTPDNLTSFRDRLTFTVSEFLALSDPKQDPRVLVFQGGGLTNSHSATYAIRIDRRAGKKNEILVVNSMGGNKEDGYQAWDEAALEGFKAALIKHNKNLAENSQAQMPDPWIKSITPRDLPHENISQMNQSCVLITASMMLFLSADPDKSFANQEIPIINHLKTLVDQNHPGNEYELRKESQPLLDLSALQTISPTMSPDELEKRTKQNKQTRIQINQTLTKFTRIKHSGYISDEDIKKEFTKTIHKRYEVHFKQIIDSLSKNEKSISHIIRDPLFNAFLDKYGKSDYHEYESENGLAHFIRSLRPELLTLENVRAGICMIHLASVVNKTLKLEEKNKIRFDLNSYCSSSPASVNNDSLNNFFNRIFDSIKEKKSSDEFKFENVEDVVKACLEACQNGNPLPTFGYKSSILGKSKHILLPDKPVPVKASTPTTNKEISYEQVYKEFCNDREKWEEPKIRGADTILTPKNPNLQPIIAKKEGVSTLIPPPSKNGNLSEEAKESLKNLVELNIARADKFIEAQPLDKEQAKILRANMTVTCPPNTDSQVVELVKEYMNSCYKNANKGFSITEKNDNSAQSTLSQRPV